MTTRPLMCFAALIIAASLFTAGVHAAAPTPPAVGTQAPDFTLKDSDGRSFVLTDALKKGPVVLAFFPRAFSAASVRQWAALRGVAASLDGAGVQLIGLSTDSMSTLKRFKKAHQLPFRMLSDGTAKVSESYGALFGFEKRRLTAQKVVVVDARGAVSYRDERYETKTDTDLRALLRAVGGD